jgi:DNA modification methylase
MKVTRHKRRKTTRDRRPRPIHPFPARMAASIPWNILKSHAGQLKVLDPMMGSGTTPVVARSLGHSAIGFDMDPLAVLISRAWSDTFDQESVLAKGRSVLVKAKSLKIKQSAAYPPAATKEVKKFVRYWFDPVSRKQLAALARSISRIHDRTTRNLLWCAFSRLIVVKKSGVSLAMDVAHSRPHRVYSTAPLRPFDGFLSSLRKALSAAPFGNSEAVGPAVRLKKGDARKLPLSSRSIDLVITSPPYLNAIDYLRGHRLSLVWMRHDLKVLRDVRATSIGAERVDLGAGDLDVDEAITAAVEDPDELSDRDHGMLTTYFHSMKLVIKEIERVLKPKGRAILVIGDSTLRGTFVSNSLAITRLARNYGLRKVRSRIRPLPHNRRYLPPPQNRSSGKQLQKRMGCEVIVTLQAA